MMRFYCALVGVILTCGAQVQAGDMVYTMSGGTFSGSLNGVSFTSATYSITATADPANVQSTVPTVSAAAVVPQTAPSPADMALQGGTLAVYI